MSLAPIEDLLAWGRHHRAQLDERVEIYDDLDFGISVRVRSSLTSAQSTIAGIKSQPSKNGCLPPESRIVSCPFNLSLSYLNALNLFPDLQAHSSMFPLQFLEELEPHVIGHFFLMQQYLNSKSSYWEPYINSLPQPDQPDRLGTPLYFSKADMAWIRGTNLEVARNLREQTWRADWSRGVVILDSALGWEMWKGRWSWLLYKWAATIFSSRSFISSLIPDEIFEISEVAEAGDKDRGNHISSAFEDAISSPSTNSHVSMVSRASGTQHTDNLRKTTFPVLFPLVDLANHSSAARVTWFIDVNADPRNLSIINGPEIPFGDQIFNNYAPKSNTELLLGYGFCVPGNDDIAIAIKSSREESSVISSGQASGMLNSNYPEEKHIFHIRRKSYDRPQHDMRLPEYGVFEDGCVDALSLLACNQREKDFLAKHADYNPEKNSEDVFVGPLSRNAFHVMSLIVDKLDAMRGEITSTGKQLGVPENSRQLAAKTYRDGQLATLEAAISPLQRRLDAAVSQHTACDHSQHISHDIPEYAIMRAHTELLTLRCAFSWLGKMYPWLHQKVIHIIATELQADVGEELDPRELVEEGWDYSLWSLWIYIVLNLQLSDTVLGGSLSAYIFAWIDNMESIYQLSFITPLTFQGEADELQALTNMTALLDPFLAHRRASSGVATSNEENTNMHEAENEMRRQRQINTASMLAKEECLVMGVKMDGLHESGDVNLQSERRRSNEEEKETEMPRLRQRVLCVMKNL